MNIEVVKVLTAAAVKKPIAGKDCPWLTIAGRAGTLEYAENVYDWLEHEFGHGHFCIVADEHWWYCEERASEDTERLDSEVRDRATVEITFTTRDGWKIVQVNDAAKLPTTKLK